MDSFLDWDERARLIELALEGHPFMRLDRWDGEPQERFQEYFAAHASLACHLDEWTAQHGHRRIRVVAVHGADLVVKCNIGSFFPTVGLSCVCVQRPGYDVPDESPEKHFYVYQLPQEFIDVHGDGDISSTVVQQLLRGDEMQRADAARMLHPRVMDWLVEKWG
eukprot:TRINITY_DN7577_c0_g1_i3.p2 TRINITY_DN7577_c0_g1~~TRINITY_DN7577_c0_g1_i3.p2  ORF type:complete len:164 (+),score=32.18 TRINITY_DN7577_c0_g1_i3:430-921(+)